MSAVAAANPHTIVVIYSSSATLMPWANQVAGILFAWYPGQENGNALAQVFLVTSIRLANFLSPSPPPPIKCVQIPRRNFPVRWVMSLTRKDCRLAIAGMTRTMSLPCFPFGFGLSYTTFGYSNLTVSAVSPSGQVQIGFDLTNTGTQIGAEVAELYLGFPAAANEPPKQLKGFQKIMLAPGQTQHVTFNLDWENLANWDATARGWIVMPGTFQVMVGASSRDLRLNGIIYCWFGNSL